MIAGGGIKLVLINDGQPQSAAIVNGWRWTCAFETTKQVNSGSFVAGWLIRRPGRHSSSHYLWWLPLWAWFTHMWQISLLLCSPIAHFLRSLIRLVCGNHWTSAWDITIATPLHGTLLHLGRRWLGQQLDRVWMWSMKLYKEALPGPELFARKPQIF